MSDIRDVTRATRTDIGYECEGCRQVYTSYRAMMLCEEADYADTVAARRAHTSPRIMRPMKDWMDD